MFFSPKRTSLMALLGLLLCTLAAPIAAAADTAKPDSLDRYHQALEVDPNNPTLHYILGLAQLKAGAAKDAIASLRMAYPAYSESIEMHYNMGLAFMQTEDPDSALLYLEQAEDLGALEMPTIFPLANAYFNVGLLYLEQESADEAEALFKKVLTLAPDRVEIHNLLGDMAARKGRIDDAIRSFSAYLAHYPDDQSARDYLYSIHLKQALKLMDEGENVAAKSAFEAAKGVSPESPLTLYYLGFLAYSAGDTKGTIDYLADSYATLPEELKESTRSMLYNSVLQLNETRQFDLALSGITPLIQVQTPRTKDLMLAGNTHLERKEYIAAEQLFEQALSIEPTHPQALINIAIAEEKAVDELFQQGLTAYKKGRFRTALEQFDRVLELQPGEHRSTGYRKKTVAKIASGANRKFKQARQAMTQKDFIQAVAKVNAGLALSPNDSGGLRLRREALRALDEDINNLIEHGFALLQHSDHTAAEAQFNKVIQIDPDNARAINGLDRSRQTRQTEALAAIARGNTALNEGDLEAAKIDFKKAETLSPDLREGVEGRARLKALVATMVAQELQLGRRERSAGNLEQAENHFKSALSLDATPEIKRELDAIIEARDHRAEGLVRAARSAREKQDYKSADRIYRQILAGNPGHPIKEEFNELQKEIADALTDRLTTARKALTAGDHQKSIKLFRTALDLDPTNNDALQGLKSGREQIKSAITQRLQTGANAFQQGELEIAAGEYRKVLQLDPYQGEARAALDRIASLKQTGIRPGDENRLYLQGIELYTQGKYAEAIRAWQQVLQLDANHNKARLNIDKAKRKLQSIKEFQSG